MFSFSFIPPQPQFFPHHPPPPGMRIRFWPKPGSGALHFKLREIFKSLLNEYFRQLFKPPVLFSYFLCQASPLSPRGPDPDPVRISPDPGWFSESSTSMVRLIPKVWKQKRWLLQLSKIFAKKLLKISLRLRYRAPDPVFWPKPDPHPWFKPDLFFSIRIQFRPKHWKLRIFRYIYNLPEDGWEGQFGGIHSRALLYPVVDLDPAHLLQCPRFTKNKSD